jgi:hypothetical protein
MDSRILKVLSVISGFAATVCLYFGSGMLLLAPRGPHEEFFDWRMFVFGILPTILGIMLIALSGWLWGQGAAWGTYARRAFNAVVTGVVLFWIALIIIAHLRGQIP